ncbi:MAG: hypothetical protein AAFP04_16295 [Myxococcota bacterium]
MTDDPASKIEKWDIELSYCDPCIGARTAPVVVTRCEYQRLLAERWKQLPTSWQTSDAEFPAWFPVHMQLGLPERSGRRERDFAGERSYRVLEDRIRRLGEDSDSEQLDRTWERLDRLSTLAEAKLRLALNAQATEPADRLPSWAKLAGSPPDGAHPRVAHSAQLLIQAMLNKLSGEEVRAELDWSKFDALDVDWEGPGSSLNWVVRPPGLPWPGVRVRSCFRAEGGAVETKVFRTAQRLLAYTEHRLAGDNGESLRTPTTRPQSRKRKRV